MSGRRNVCTLHTANQDTGMSGREDLYYLSCLVADFLFHQKTPTFPLMQSRALPEGVCLGGVQMLPNDPFSAPFHTCSVQFPSNSLSSASNQARLIIPPDRCKKHWIHGRKLPVMRKLPLQIMSQISVETCTVPEPGQATDSTAGFCSPNRYPKADFLLIKYENL